MANIDDLDFSTMTREDARHRYDTAVNLKNKSKQALDNLSANKGEFGTYDSNQSRQFKLYNNGYNTGLEYEKRLLEEFPDLLQEQQPEGPGKGKAIGLNMLKGAVETPYDIATSPVTLPAMVNKMSPLNALAGKAREMYTGKPTSDSFDKAMGYVERGGEKIYGKDGPIPIRPAVEKANEESGLGQFGQIASQIGGSMAAMGGVSKLGALGKAKPSATGGGGGVVDIPPPSSPLPSTSGGVMEIPAAPKGASVDDLMGGVKPPSATKPVQTEMDLGNMAAPAPAKNPVTGEIEMTTGKVPVDPDAVPAPPSVVPLKSNSKIDLTGFGKGVADSMYDMLWKKVLKGDIKENGVPSTYLLVAKALRDKGKLPDRDTFINIAREVSTVKDKNLKGKDFQDAIKGVIAKYDPPTKVLPKETNAAKPIITSDMDEATRVQALREHMARPRGEEPIVPLKPDDKSIPEAATPTEQVTQGLADHQLRVKKPEAPKVTSDVASMQDFIINTIKQAKDKGTEKLTQKELRDKIAFSPKWDTLTVPEFDDLFKNAMGALEESKRVSKIARSQPKTTINNELISSLSSKLEAHPSMQGISVRNMGDNKIQLRDTLSGETVRTLDLNDDKTLTDLIKVLNMSDVEEGGTTLASGFGGLDAVTKSAFNKVGSSFKKTIRALELNTPETTSNFWKSVTEPFESPLFFFRKSKTGSQVTDAALNAKASAINIARESLYRWSPETGLTKTNFFKFDDMADDLRRPVERLLVEGDYKGHIFDDAELIARGLSDEQITAYHGVRELLEDIKDRITETNAMLIKSGVKRIKGEDPKTMTPDVVEFESSFGYRQGYLPRKWFGDWEVYVNDPTTGTKSKYLTKVPDMDLKFGTSSFPNKYRAQSVADSLKSDPSLAGKTITVEQFNKEGFGAHLLERKGIIGYETQKIREVLHEYIGQQAKWQANAQFKVQLKNILDNATKLSDTERSRIQRYAQRFLGEKGMVDVASDWLLNNMPGLSNIVKTSDPSGQVLGGVRGIVTHMSLGMGNFAYALVNVTGLANHTYPALSRYAGSFGKRTGKHISERGLITDGIKTYLNGLKHKAGGTRSDESDLMSELVHKGVVDIQFWTEQAPLKSSEIFGRQTGKAVDFISELSLVMGRTTEELSRVVTAVAGYKLARKAGGSHEDGIKFATKFVAETMADFSKAGKPPIYTSHVGGTLGQFKTYGQVMIENMYRNTFEGNFKSVMKYWATTIGLGGYYGLPEARALDHYFNTLTGISPLEESTKWLKSKGIDSFLATGVMSSAPGWLGMESLNTDMSGRIGVGDVLPDSPTDFVAFNKIIQPLNQLLVHADPKAAMRAASINSPGLRYYMNKDDQGNILDTKGNILYRPDEGESAIEVLGFTPQRRGDIYRLSGISAARNAHSKDKYTDIKQQFLRGEISASEARKLGLTNKQVNNLKRSQNKDKMNRIIEGAPKSDRRQLKESPFYQTPTR